MENIKSVLLIVAVIVPAIIISVWVLLGIFFKRLETAGKERVNERFTNDQIVRLDPRANFFGLESRGRGQVRGNGVLVLTQNELWFSRYVMREDFTIPLETIREVRLVNSHLGKMIIGRKLLYVQFVSPTGLDAVAWWVGNPNVWKTAIESSI